MAIDPNAYKNAQHTGRFIGPKGNEGMAVYNPETDKYERYTKDEWHKKSLAGRKETGNNIAHFYANKYGENVYGLRPTETHMGMLSGESFLQAGPDPYANKYIRNDNGTPVPSAGTLNPNFVEPASRYQTRTPEQQAALGIQYHGAKGTPEQMARAIAANNPGQFNQAIANNPEKFGQAMIANATPEQRAHLESLVTKPQTAEQAMGSAVVNNNPSVLNNLDPLAWYNPEFLSQLDGEQSLAAASKYADIFHANKNDLAAHARTMEAGQAFTADADFLTKLGNYAEENRTGVQEFLNTARGLHMHNPEAFEEWELANPEMALRYHARAAAGNGNVGGIEGYDHAGRAQALSYGISQQLGFGEDGKQDGTAIAYDFDQFNDVNTESGDGDFWKLGTAQTFTNDFSDFIEDNPLEFAGTIALAAFAPQIVGFIAPGLTGVAAGVASGALTSLGNGLIMGNTDDLLMSTLKGGLTGGLGAWAGGAEGILVSDYGFNESVANIATSAVGDAVINGTDPVQALVSAVGAEGISIAVDKAADMVGGMFSTDEAQVTVNADGTTELKVNEGTLEELDIFSQSPEGAAALEEITVDAEYRPTLPSGSPEIPVESSPTLDDVLPSEPLEPIDLDSIPDQRPTYDNNSSYDGRGSDGVEHITVTGESGVTTGRAPTQGDLVAFDAADSLGLGDTVDGMMQANPNLTGEEAFRLAMSTMNPQGLTLSQGDYAKFLSAEDPMRYLRLYHPEFAVSIGADLDQVTNTNTGGYVDQSGVGSHTPPPNAIIGDPGAQPSYRPTTPGADDGGAELIRPDSSDYDFSQDITEGPLFEPDSPTLPDFDAPEIEMPEIIMDGFDADNSINPWRLSEEIQQEVKDNLSAAIGGTSFEITEVQEVISDAADAVMDPNVSTAVSDAVDDIVYEVVAGSGEIAQEALEGLSEADRDAVIGSVVDVLGDLGVSSEDFENIVDGSGPSGGPSPSAPSGPTAPSGPSDIPSGSGGTGGTGDTGGSSGGQGEIVGTGIADGGGPIRIGSTVAGAQVIGTTQSGNLVVRDGDTIGQLTPEGDRIFGSFRRTGDAVAGTDPFPNSHPGVVGGVHAGTGETVGGGGTGGSGGSGVTGGAGGTGSTSGSGSTSSGSGGTGGQGMGDGTGDGMGDGSGLGGTGDPTPLATGLMQSLERTPIPLTTANRSTKISTRPLFWGHLGGNR